MYGRSLRATVVMYLCCLSLIGNRWQYFLSADPCDTFPYTDVQSFTRYRFSISSLTSAGQGPTLTTNITTLPSTPGAAPQGFTVALPLDDPLQYSKSVLLTWQAPLAYRQNGVIEGYTISYAYSDSRLVPSQGNETWLVVRGLSTTIDGKMRVTHAPFEYIIDQTDIHEADPFTSSVVYLEVVTHTHSLSLSLSFCLSLSLSLDLTSLPSSLPWFAIIHFEASFRLWTTHSRYGHLHLWVIPHFPLPSLLSRALPFRSVRI